MLLALDPSDDSEHPNMTQKVKQKNNTYHEAFNKLTVNRVVSPGHAEEEATSEREGRD